MYWHLLYSSLSGGNQVQGNSILGKKICAREIAVEVRFFFGCTGCYLWNSRDFPYNRNDAILIPFHLSRLLAAPRGGKIARLFNACWSVTVVCIVVSNSLMTIPEMIGMTGLIAFDELSSWCF